MRVRSASHNLFEQGLLSLRQDNYFCLGTGHDSSCQLACLLDDLAIGSLPQLLPFSDWWVISAALV
jgi:hypothetical protein